VILAILFWGWLWGIAGGLMAAPLLTILKIVCDQFPSLSSMSAFVAGGTEEAKNNHRERSSSTAAEPSKRSSRSGLAVAGHSRRPGQGS
jgi:hypothetical protein